MPEGESAGIRGAVPGREGFDPRASTGLFVGVSAFKDPRFAAVPFAVDDAVDLAHLFAVELALLLPERATLALSGEPKKPESQARLAALLAAGARSVGARQADLYEELEKSAGASGSEGLFLLTVATHGLTDQGGDFLIARDSLARRRVRTGVAVDELFDDVARATARRRLVLLDACRERLSEATRGPGAAAMAASFADAIARASGQVVLSGATHGGFAYDDTDRGNGVFTAAILDGLRGAAAADPRGLITVRTLADYVQQQVTAWVRRHRPDHGAISRGIERRIEGEAESLPLAVNPAIYQTFERYARRREAALGKLRQNLGPVLTGSLFDQLVGLLPEERPLSAATVDGLLNEIEALDGTERSQRSLRDFVREQHGGPSPPPSPPTPPQPVKAPVEVVQRPREKAPQRPSPPKVPRWRGPAFLIGGSLLVLLAVLGVWKFVLWASNPEETTNGGGVIESAEEAPPPTEKGPPQNPKKAGEPWEGPLGMRFRFVPPGTYTVGSPADEPGRYHWEWPRHQLQIAPGFWIAETEVTQEQWEAMGLINPSLFQNCGSDCPVEQVNWFEAAQYANLLSDREGLGVCYDLHGCDGKLGKDFACISAVVLGPDCEGFRLPTEVEWEVAARAGTKTPIHSGKLTLVGNRNAPELNPIAWYGGNSSVAYEGGNKCSMWPEMQFPARYCGTHPVRKKQGNSWELYDMLGNVWEWCTDWYGPYDGNVHISPLGPGRGSFRVFRGGSWLHNARYVRAAYRSHASPSSRYSYLGFRLARGQVLSEEAEPTGQ